MVTFLEEKKTFMQIKQPEIIIYLKVTNSEDDQRQRRQ